MLDIHGIEIKVGMRVKTQQHGGGLLPPAPPVIGIVEQCTDSRVFDALCIRYNHHSGFDRFILLEGKINEIVNTY